MGKGDKKTKRGKIIKGTFGRLRPKNKHKNSDYKAKGEQQIETRTEKAVNETKPKQPAKTKAKTKKLPKEEKKEEKE